jgi:hypothetical protein
METIMYIPTIWKEHSMTGLQKATALTNLESMYDESTSYIDSLTHAASYYTKAEADGKYFPVSTKTANSVAATLDGVSAAQIIASGVPSGCIAIWSGALLSIPSGWVLCNGLNNSPDLRDFFIPGAGSHYSKGDSGGSNAVTTTATVTIAGYALQIADIPEHYHSLTEYGTGGGRPAVAAGTYAYANAATSTTRNTQSTGGGGSHTHTATFTGIEQAKMPYYAACFIMKV